MKNKNVLVTGASGFIGCRLAERLSADEGASVTGTGRLLDKVSFLSEKGVNLQVVEMTDREELKKVATGKDIVFHLAVAGGRSKPETAYRVNVTAVEELVRAAAGAGVKRFVHVSSMAAYGPPVQEFITEDHPLDTNQGGRYGRTKALGEIRAMEVAGDLGLELTVIRPGMVFGPQGRSWSINLLKLIKWGMPVIFGDGLGHAQPIYLDNLIDGMLLAATRPEAAGQSFNFMDTHLPWKKFLSYYGQMSGRNIRKVPLWLARFGLILFKRIAGRTESVEDLLRFYTNKSYYPTNKAEMMLGYSPKISILAGMKRTEAWFRESGYLPAIKQQARNAS